MTVEYVLSSLYVYSASVALQALTVISMGGIANHRTLYYTADVRYNC
jgi:hypothetical protein